MGGVGGLGGDDPRGVCGYGLGLLPADVRFFWQAVLIDVLVYGYKVTLMEDGESSIDTDNCPNQYNVSPN